QQYSNGQATEGAAFIFFGTPGRVTAPQVQLGTGAPGAEYGYAVTSGDFNDDGYSDVVIGAPYYDNDMSYEGRVFVYNGSSSGLLPSTSWELPGDQYKGYVGISLANAGDVNADGYDDLLVGASGYSNPGLTAEGHAFLFYGGASGLAGAPVSSLGQAAWSG